MMQHPCEPLIRSTGLRRAALYHDVCCALHRLQATGNELELECLLDEQLLMMLVITNQPPGSEAWAYVEKRLGRELPRG